MSNNEERRHCEEAADRWLDETTAEPFNCVGATRDERKSLADVIERERAHARTAERVRALASPKP